MLNNLSTSEMWFGTGMSKAKCVNETGLRHQQVTNQHQTVTMLTPWGLLRSPFPTEGLEITIAQLKGFESDVQSLSWQWVLLGACNIRPGQNTPGAMTSQPRAESVSRLVTELTSRPTTSPAYKHTNLDYVSNRQSIDIDCHHVSHLTAISMNYTLC